MKEWELENRGIWKHRKEDVLNQIASLETIQEQRTLNVGERLHKAKLFNEFAEISRNEEIAWRQRSRVQWLKQGDKNTKYFQLMATSHKRFNTIDKLEVEGVIISESEEIMNEVVSFYQKLYKESEQWRPHFNLQGSESISVEEKEWLQRQFEEDEVLETLKFCSSDKAPGLDGFPMSFYQSFWEMLKEDLLSTLRQFHDK